MTDIKTHTLSEGVLSIIGNTPVVRLANLFPEYNLNLFAKLELLNPGGSIKDRTAYNILLQAIIQGKISKGTTVIESSSGNMAIGLAQVCLKYGLNLIIVADPLINVHTLKILAAYGVQIEKVTTPSQNGSYLTARLERVHHLLNEVENGFWPNQYANQANPMAHRQTMKEMVTALGGNIDYLFIATSTCGTIMGCAEYAREAGLNTKIIAVDAEGSAIFNQPLAKRLIPGHGAGKSSHLLNPDLIADVIHVSDKDCVIGCHQLLYREAILAGGSSGAVVSAIRKYLSQVPENANCAMIICDRGERYLDTIYSKVWVKKHFNGIELETEELQSTF